MSEYTIAATKSSPAIDFSPAAGLLRIRGESYPENCSLFYQPLFERLRGHLVAAPRCPLLVEMEIVYFNSSSSKAFMDFFDLLDEAAASGTPVSVDWRYHEENETAQECGEEFQEDVEHLHFRLVPLSD